MATPMQSLCGARFYGGHAWGSLVSAGFLLQPVYQPAYGHHPSFGSESDGS